MTPERQAYEEAIERLAKAIEAYEAEPYPRMLARLNAARHQLTVARRALDIAEGPPAARTLTDFFG